MEARAARPVIEAAFMYAVKLGEPEAAADLPRLILALRDACDELLDAWGVS